MGTPLVLDMRPSAVVALDSKCLAWMVEEQRQSCMMVLQDAKNRKLVIFFYTIHEQFGTAEFIYQRKKFSKLLKLHSHNQLLTGVVLFISQCSAPKAVIFVSLWSKCREFFDIFAHFFFPTLHKMWKFQLNFELSMFMCERSLNGFNHN